MCMVRESEATVRPGNTAAEDAAWDAGYEAGKADARAEIIDTDDLRHRPVEVRMPLGYSVASLAAETELSKQTIYREIEEGRLRVKRVRGRLVIPADAVTEWLNDTGESA